MNKSVGYGSRWFTLANSILLILMSAIFLYPFIFIIALSLSEKAAVVAGKVHFFPIGFNFDSYKQVVANPSFMRSYINSVYYAVSGTLLVLFFTSLTAYPLSIPSFCYKKVVTTLFAVTMFFGGGLIPTYLLIRSLGMIDTVWVLILPGCVSAWNVIIFRTFFSGIPSSLQESAVIDGANDFYILYKIIIPLSKPILATVALFSIVGSWNNFFGPFIYLTSNTQEYFNYQG